MVLADCPGLDLKGARKLAAETYAAICRDRDPQAERKATRRAKKIAAAPVKDYAEKIIKRYVRDYAIPRTRASTSGETEPILRADVLPIWRGRRLSEITKADVRQLIDGIVRRGAPVAANRTLAAIKTMFAFAIEQDILTVSPCAGLRPPAAETSRDRVLLADHELGAVWQACRASTPAQIGKARRCAARMAISSECCF